MFRKANKLWGSDLLWTTIPSTGSGNTIVFVVVVVVVVDDDDALVTSFITVFSFFFTFQRQLDRLMDFIDINDDGEIEFRYLFFSLKKKFNRNL